MWNRGINSDVVLRSLNKSGERAGGLRGASGGVGGTRGGRGRGGAAFYRSAPERYDEAGDPPFQRQRPFDRPQVSLHIPRPCKSFISNNIYFLKNTFLL